MCMLGPKHTWQGGQIETSHLRKWRNIPAHSHGLWDLSQSFLLSKKRSIRGEGEHLKM